MTGLRDVSEFVGDQLPTRTRARRILAVSEHNMRSHRVSIGVHRPRRFSRPSVGVHTNSAEILPWSGGRGGGTHDRIRDTIGFLLVIIAGRGDGQLSARG